MREGVTGIHQADPSSKAPRRLIATPNSRRVAFVPDGEIAEDDETPPLVVQIQRWIESTGYALEMRVARAFARLPRTTVEQSVAFLDPDTSVVRETDVRVTWRSSDGDSVTFVVECKAQSEPWVILVSKTSANAVDGFDSLRNLRAAWGQWPLFLDRLSKSGEMDRLERLSLFRWDRPSGYTMVPKRDEGKKGTDPCFEALTSAVKATVYLSRAGVGSRAHFFVPLVVTQSRLIEVALDEDGEIEANEVPHGRVLWRHHAAGDGAPTVVDVLAANAVDRFAWHCDYEVLSLLDLMREKLS